MGDIFKKLAKHLDNLPGGFPETDSGVELRILKQLFTPEEAEIATGLQMMPEPAASIAERLNLNATYLQPILEDMANNGLIFRMEKNDQVLFMAAQFVVGIWEFHVNSLTEELINDFNEYLPYLMKERWIKQKTKQLRVIPVSKSISAEMNIMPYDQAENIIKKQSKIVVAPCICRKEHTMVGKGCNMPLETCLVFGNGAFYYEKNKMGRSITSDEALDILKQGLEAGLVLQPGNSQKPANICMCCGCCCQILKNLKTLDSPAKAVCSNYFAVVDTDNCTACGTCEERCQMDAITVEDTADVNTEKCIGCGLCVTSCEYDALSLEEKREEDKWVPPQNMFKTFINIAQERGMI